MISTLLDMEKEILQWSALTGCSVEWMVDVICHPSRRAPVIATVLEEKVSFIYRVHFIKRHF